MFTPMLTAPERSTIARATHEENELAAGRVELRIVPSGETVELLHLLQPAPMHSDCGTGRPMPRYVAPEADDRIAVVAELIHGAERPTTVGVGVARPLEHHGVAEVELFVVPAYRGQGLGSRLFSRLIRLVEVKGIRRVRFCVPPSETDIFGLLMRMPMQPTIWEDADRTIVEFPTAAF